MAVEYQEKSWMLRWLRRCPLCGGCFALHLDCEHKSFMGVRRVYVCRHCAAKLEDWKPSDEVEF